MTHLHSTIRMAYASFVERTANVTGNVSFQKPLVMDFAHPLRPQTAASMDPKHGFIC
jgi:hypothetical protein